MHDDRRSAATIGKKFCLPPNVSVLESILFKDVTMIEHIRQRIAHAPRIPLGVWPTPFMAMDHLRETIGSSCPRLWVKREDLTPLGAGGNKVRKLEFVLARAMAEGADVLLNTGEVQSNQVVQTAAAAAHLGIPCELFLGCMTRRCPRMRRIRATFCCAAFWVPVFIFCLQERTGPPPCGPELKS